jgi:orotidine-5'-phosphate decarboxylase
MKFHDIPATVRGALSSAAALGVEFITVHCDQGKGLLQAVVEGTRGKTKVLAVTVLTSLNKDDLQSLGFREEYQKDMGLLVLDRARLAQEAGCAGVVCSGLEVRRVKREMGSDFLVVTPGIRPEWSLVKGDDQKRVATPGQAIRDGADYLVVGRPIRDAKDRREAARRVAYEIEQALAGIPEKR